jgi:hypothetical protein
MLLALFLAACGQPTEKSETPAAPQAPNPFDLHIEVGRYGVMLSQVGSLTGERESATEPDDTSPATLARNLRETVWEYNLARSQLCGKGLFTEVSCGPSYEPVWIGDDAAPSLEELQTRSTAVGAEVMRLWNAVCEDARTREADEQARMYVCAIE